MTVNRFVMPPYFLIMGIARTQVKVFPFLGGVKSLGQIGQFRPASSDGAEYTANDGRENYSSLFPCSHDRRPRLHDLQAKNMSYLFCALGARWFCIGGRRGGAT